MLIIIFNIKSSKLFIFINNKNIDNAPIIDPKKIPYFLVCFFNIFFVVNKSKKSKKRFISNITSKYIFKFITHIHYKKKTSINLSNYFFIHSKEVIDILYIQLYVS